jgi:transcription elongation factor GreA
MSRQPITKEGYEKLQAEIKELEDKKPAIQERIKIAREEGDLKENAEYHAAREALQARVTVKDLSDGMEEIYELVGPGDEDFDGDILKILSSSPLALAMLGKKVGDQFEAQIPAGVLKMEVVAIEAAE